MSALAGAALCAATAVFVSGQVGPNIAPLAHEVTTIKPSTPKKPGHDDDDCIPSRLINHPHGGIIGEEECPDGSKIHTRLK
jgi:hypothetical protein